ncbi:uncharacterized protein LOC124543745 [Vanessa cardui]|uniref:uncharacterized protein LOC124543690 n=1 Tax=Vanessa cardui TaxID=171605 RepID=UPI001F142A12|nr:uncharacterized protein LOC124543690 [Vanessa cardui]XP_046977991.1 uncharacterized protein LOC124543745 [Vanessa cardui]
MFRIASFCLLVILQVVTSEPPPPQCRRIPRVENPTKCCNFPKIFKEEDFKDCDIALPHETSSKPGPPDCSKQICLLKKYNLMKDDTEVDKDAATEFLDKFAESYPDFKNGVEKAKEFCIKKDLPDSKVCKPTHMVFCISNILFMECPKWEEIDDCKQIKDYVEECKPYFENTN